MKKALAILVALTLVFMVSLAVAEETEAPDGTFQIVLTGNPTTGYTWIHVLSDETIAEITEEYLTGTDIDKLAGIESSDDLLVGEGGFYVFTVKGLKPGTAVLAFEYGQEWDETSTMAGLTFVLTVNEDLSVVANTCYLGI